MMVDRRLEGKYRFFRGLIIAVFAVLGLRLAALQLLEAPVYRTKAELNQFRFLPIRAPRGDIVDRNGKVLAGSKIVNTVSLVRQQSDSRELEQTISSLAAVLSDTYPEIDAAYIRKLLAEHKGRPYEPVVIKRDIPMEVVSRLEERRAELPGVVIGKEIVRFYPEGALASHVLGYVGEISASELERLREEKYKLGDLIGKFGLEARYEKYLRGQDGFQQVEVDVRGRPIPHKDLITVPPKQGNRLVLTIDYDLQKTLEASMDRVLAELRKKGHPAKAGAAVVLDVRSGAVLAMASRPGFDPNRLVPPVSVSAVREYLNPPPGEEPTMVNRAISSRYPPGSTFKPITGMAALEAGKISLQELVTCKGSYWLKPFTGCWQVHGPVNFFRAMAVSCNVFFIEAGRRAGAEMMARVAREFGLDAPTGIDLPGEVAGNLPSPAKKRAENWPKRERWYREEQAKLEEKYQGLLAGAETSAERERILARKRDEERQLRDLYQMKGFYVNWQPFETFNMAIGQGESEFTPLELASYVAALANDGKRMRPYLVQRIEDRQGRVVARFGPHVVHRVSVSRQTMETVREAMTRVTAPGGTASWLFSDFPVKVAAKTGTAQSGRKLGGRELYHGVFVAFAPAEEPEIAFAGVIEYGYHGSESAGIVAKDVFTEYFGLKEQEAGAGEEREAAPPAVQPRRSAPPAYQAAPGERTPAPPPAGGEPFPGPGEPPPAEQQPSGSGEQPGESDGIAPPDGSAGSQDQPPDGSAPPNPPG